MQKYTRWSAILVVLMLILAACQSDGGGDGSPGATDGGGGTGSAADCDADEFGCVEIAEGDPMTVGTIFVISGANETLGTDSQIGVDVAAQMRPEISGHAVEFNEQDGLCGPDGGTAAAQALVTEPGIVGIIGTSCSGAGVPAAEITSAEGIVLISPSNTAPSLTAEDTHQPFYARTAHNDEIQGAAMAEYVCDVLGLTTAATIHDGSPYAEQLQAVFAEEFAAGCDGTVTAQEAVTVGQTDFSGVLSNIAADEPEFLYYPIFVAEGALITQQARDTAGLEDTILAGADGMLNTDWLSAAGEAGEGVVLSGPDLNFTGDFYENEFLPVYSDISGLEEPTSVFHAHAYDAYNILADAIEAVAFTDGGTTYVPRSALRDAVLATEGYEGITGTLSCDETGDCANAQISVSEVQDGEFVRIWPEE
ncbi:MAG: branched-chain amino acid ABC transporter substrate-binding protein [Candidatus Limnocylindria bacterium]